MIDKTISIAIVTRNRNNSLRRCLSSLTKQQLSSLEVLVIDNASADKTKKVALSFKHLLPMRYIYEPTIGIPFARNRALKEAKGEILAFIDDDCAATPTWTTEILKAHGEYLEIVAIQGSCKSMPRNNLLAGIFEINYLCWLKTNLQKNLLSICDTKNLSLKISLVRRLKLLFDTKFERCSDVDFAKQLLKTRQKILYYPQILIYHWEREKIIDFLQQQYRIGQGQATLEHKWPNTLTEINQKKKDRYVQIMKHMLSRFSPNRRIFLRILLKIHRQIFWLGINSMKGSQQLKFIKPINKKVNNVTVAIVTRNRACLLEHCLFSLARQTVCPKEILVIDNGSADQTRDVALSFKKIMPIRYVSEVNIGTPYARNRALKEARGEILAFIDDDCEATLTWIEEMVKAHEAYPKVAAIQGKSYGLPRYEILSIVSQKEYEGWIRRYLVNDNNIIVMDTKNVSLKRSVLKNLAIQFDNIFSPYSYSEDVDLAIQLLSKKQAIIYYPQAEVSAWWPVDLFSLLRQRYRRGLARAVLDYKWLTFFARRSDIRELMQKSPAIYQGSKWYQIPFLVMGLFLMKTAFKIGYRLGTMKIDYDNSRLTTLSRNLETPLPGIKIADKSLQLSIMIITKDRYWSLARCLRSLINQTKKADQIIIVDSSSQHNLAVIDKFRKDLPITYIYEKKLGFGIARNTGIKRAKSDILATIDDDGEAAPGWCENIVKVHLQNPESIAVQGRIISKPLTSPWAFVEQIRMDRWFLNNIDRTGQIRTISTKNVSFKLQRFRKLKLNFSTLSAFNTFGAEDIDMARQILLAKEAIIFSPSVSVCHWERQTLISYLKQQYRKGRSNSLLVEWLKQEKQPSLLSLPKVMQPILELTQHPLTRGNILRIFQLLPIYYLSLIFFQRGLSQKSLKMQTSMVIKQKNARSFVVAIITRNRAQSLRRALYCLENQTVLPTEVIVVDNKSSDNTREVATSFKITLKIKYCYEKEVGIPYARNRVLKETKGKILAFIDDDCEAIPTWVEKMLEGHKKYPDAAVLQGMSISKPSDRLLSIIAQFNRQTWVRDNMIGDRNSYWELAYGAKKKGVDVTVCESYNLSIKVARIRQHHVQFNDEFAQELLSEDERIIFYPKAMVYHNEKRTIPQFLRESFLKGRELGITETRWPPEYFSLIKKSNVERAFSFLYFCVVHKYFIRLPILLFLFLLYQQAFNKGKHAEVMNISL